MNTELSANAGSFFVFGLVVKKGEGTLNYGIWIMLASKGYKSKN